MPELRLIGDRIQVELDPRGSPEDLIIDLHKEVDPTWATVIAVGTGRATKRGVRIPLGVNAGDRVLVMPQHKDTMQSKALARNIFDNPRMIIIQEGDVLVVQER